jgi:hypothetical protein
MPVTPEHVSPLPCAPSPLRSCRFLIAVIAISLGVAGSALPAAAGARTARHRSNKVRHRSGKVLRRSGKIRRAGHGAPRGVASHIATWAFDDGCNGGAGSSSSLVRRWLTDAESNCGPAAHKAQADCRSGRRSYCNVVQYLDTDWDFPEQPPLIASAAAETWWLHEPSRDGGTRIFSNDTSGSGYLDNQSIPAVRAYFQSYVRRYFNSDHDLLMDWQSPSLSQELYYSTCHCTRTSEIRSNAALQAAHDAMAAAMTHRNGRPFVQADNTLPSNPYLPQGMNMLNHRTGVDGWTVEGEPVDNDVLDPYYSTLLDQIAYISTRTRGFIVPMSRAPEGAPYQAQSRQIQEGTMLLGFSAGHLVDWAALEQGSSNLAVWPEEGIYPTRPVESMGRPGGRGCLAGTGVVCSRGGHNGVQVAPGVYRRAFRSCYLNRVRFGACATVVNTTGAPVVVRRSWLRGASLHHQIAFNGGDVQSGGSLRLDGAPFAAGTTVVPAQDALLLSQ